MNKDEFYTHIVRYLTTGCLIFTWEKNLVAHLIENATKGGPSHVRFVIGNISGLWVTAEMTWPRVRISSVFDLDPDEPLEIGRHQWMGQVSNGAWYQGVAWIERLLEARIHYDFSELLVFLFKELHIPVSDFSDPEQTVCSTFVCRLHKAMGVPWGSDFLSPQGIREDKNYRPIYFHDSNNQLRGGDHVWHGVEEGQTRP